MGLLSRVLKEAAWPALGAAGGYAIAPEDEKGTYAAAGALGGVVAPRLVARLDPTRMGTFGGQFAKTADKAKLARAQEMDAAGSDRRAIWDATGWFKGTDGKWRFEIDDSGSGFRTDRMPSGASTTNLGNVLEHDEVFGAYPDSRFIQVRNDFRPGFDGAYNPIAEELSINSRMGAKGVRSTALHENQHSIQEREGFAQGGTPDGEAALATLDRAKARNTAELAYRDFLAAHPKEDKLWSQVLDGLEGYARGNSWKGALAKLERTDVGRELILLHRAKLASEEAPQINAASATERYNRLAGEVEARNVQTRRDFTPDQRRAQAPWETQDVPDDQQIVRFGSGGLLSRLR